MENNTQQNKITNLMYIFIHYAVFIVIWTIFVLLNKKHHINNLFNSIFGIGDIIFLASGLALIFTNKKRLALSPKTIFTTPPKLKILLPFLAVIVIYYAITMFIKYGGFYINPERSIPKLIVMFAIVGTQEELLFRGYFYNALANNLSKRKANLISAALFMLVHYPGWFLVGTPLPAIAYMSIGSFFLGLVFGYSFRKTQSIWLPAILHMVWNIFSYLI